LQTYGIVLAFVILVAVVAASSPGFATRTNIFNLFSQWAPAGVMAVAMTFVILAGGFDLSIANGFSLCAVTAAAVGRAEDPAVAFLAALAVGLAIGLVNGVLVAGAKINPFITTVGTGFVLGGIALVATGNIAYIVANPDFGTIGAGRWHGFPYSGMILVFCLVAGGLVLARTVYGQSIYAVGGNAEASRLSGIRVVSTIGSTYVLSGLAMGVAGVITASQLNSAQANINPSIVFDVITIVVVGGTSLAGGVGSMWRTSTPSTRTSSRGASSSAPPASTSTRGAWPAVPACGTLASAKREIEAGRRTGWALAVTTERPVRRILEQRG
jgi:ribose transport system permease protein